MTDQTSIKSNRLQGKVAIVTGGASGIGEATVHNFANHGAHAIVIADIQDDKGKKLAEIIGSHRCIYIHCDVSNEENVKFLIKSTVKKYGRLDIMFSNAGIGSNKSNQTVLEFDLSEDEFDKVFAVNVKGMAACVKHAAKVMVDGGVSGSIICTTSVLASRGFDTFTDYVMSKHAILGLVRSASLQLGSHGIRVNSVAPGTVGTPLLRSKLGLDKEEDKLVEKSSGLKGMLTAKHLADAVVFLASEESEFVTGVDFIVDGGYVPLPLV